MPTIAASMALLFSGCERSLIYYPSEVTEEQLQQIAKTQKLEAWRDGDGDRIGWSVRADSPTALRSAMVVFHGNAGHAAHRAHYARGFQQEASEAALDVFLLEYPGYGTRNGKPSEKSIKAAAISAVEALDTRGYDRLYLVGESLGSGVACHVAATFPERVSGVFLVTPFTSLREVAQHHYPRFLVSALLREGWDNVKALGRFDGPVAVLLAGRDEIVPAALGRKLFDAYEGAKKMWVQEGSSHNSLSFESDDRWWTEVLMFLNTSVAAD